MSDKTQNSAPGKKGKSAELYMGEASNSKKSKKRKKPLTGRKKALITVFSVLGALIIGAGAYAALIYTNAVPAPGFMAGALAGGSFRFDKGIYVNDISLEGLTEDEAVELLKNNTDKFSSPVNLVLKANGKEVTLTAADFFYKYDIEEIVETAKEECCASHTRFGKKDKEEKHYTVTAVFDEETVDAVDVIVCPVLDIPATNAKLISATETKLNFADGKNGSAVDRDAMHAAIIGFFESGEPSGELELAVVPVKPDVTAENMSGEITLLASFSTVSTNSANGNKNMKTALAACNDSVILPGKSWSFNGCTGNSNLTSKGYVGATVINGGKLETGIGGGICQASTTIYNALLYAGLEITERHNHYWAATYAKAGFDATIDYPRLDLKFKNNTDFPIYLKCSMSGKTLTVKVFGKKSADFDEVKLSAKETARVAGDYYTVQSYRSFYKGGKLVRTENLGSSKYSLKKATSASTSTSSTPPASSGEPTPSETPSETPSSTPSETPSETPSSTPSETPSETPSVTPSETPEPQDPSASEFTTGETSE